MDKSSLTMTKKTKLTHGRQEFIRQNSHRPIEHLMWATGLSRYAVSIVILAKNQNYWKGIPGGGVNYSKFSRLTPRMKKYLKNTKHETNWELRCKFNRTFRTSYLTPMHDRTLKKYRERLVEGEKAD